MRKYFISMALISVAFAMNVNSQKTKVEEVKVICENLSLSQKPIVAVAPFKISVSNAANVGTGLSDMMMNALLNSGCFRVVERERLNVIMEEQGMGLSGAGDEASFAKVGKQIGSQLIIMGTITEFSENEAGAGAAGVGILRRTIPGVAGAGMKKAHIGYTLRLVNPTTGEIVAMQSFDKKRNSVGVATGGRFGAALGGAVFYKSKAMQDAVEESLIDAVEYISQRKGDFMASVAETKKDNAANEVLKIEKKDCDVLKLSRRPKIMVIIPEEHLAGAGSSYDPNRSTININLNKSSESNNSNYSNQSNSSNSGVESINTVRGMFRPPDPAGETEIMKRFLEFGFDLVDAKQYEKLRSDKQFLDAYDNPKIATQIASKFGADIIIVGEAFSEYSKANNNMTSCRARVEAKAIITNNAKILAADGLHGSGLDVSEVIAGKTALKNAGSKIADYFLAQLCSKADEVAASFGNKISGTKETEIKFSNVDYSKVSSLSKIIQSCKQVTKSERTTFADNIAIFNVQYTGSLDELIQKILSSSKTAGVKLDVTSISENNASIAVK